MTRATFHPIVRVLLMSGWYFVIFLSRVYAANMSLQYAYCMNCIVILVEGASGGGGYMDVL